jgi:hypothetical protein
MPTDPKRLQIIDRIVEVLKTISAGTDYFYTPIEVDKGFKAEMRGYPSYFVTSESGGEIGMNMDELWDETFYIAVHGVVKSAEDVVTPLERAIRDVRKAINTDFMPDAGAGSLITLATAVTIDSPPEIDYGFEGQGFFGYFTQRIRIQTFGRFGEI